MSAQLDLVAKRAATWSQSANRLKKRIDFVRWLVFALAIVGALLAAVASQTQEAQALHGALTALGTVLLAAGTFISAQLLKDTELEAWVRKRAAAEALKREAFKYATRARPYDDRAKADQVLDRCREDRDSHAARNTALPIARVRHCGSAPQRRQRSARAHRHRKRPCAEVRHPVVRTSAAGRSALVRGLQGAIERRLSDAHSTRNGTGRFSTFDESPSVIYLRRSQSRPPTQANATLLRRLDSRLRPLDDQAALELGQSAHDVHHQASAGTRGVDRIGQAAKV